MYQNHLRPFSLVIADAPCIATLDDKDRAIVEMGAATEVRVDQLIAALDRRKEALQVARDRSGETAANDRYKSRFDEKYDAYTRVSIVRARTLSGVLAKLALIASDFDDESASELPAEVGQSEPILYSVAVDFKALKAGEARS